MELATTVIISLILRMHFILKISGRIMWARQLFNHLQISMEKLAQYQELVKTVDGKRTIKNYNKIAAALTEYEVRVGLYFLFLRACAI